MRRKIGNWIPGRMNLSFMHRSFPGLRIETWGTQIWYTVELTGTYTTIVAAA
jgi:hypothetical protein